MEQLRCQKCYRRLLDVESQKYRIRIRCRHCHIWCGFVRDSSACEQEPKSVFSNADMK